MTVILSALIYFNIYAVVSEASDGYYVNIYKEYYEYNEGLVENTWNGKTSLKENTVYYVDKKITISVTRVIPASSMLVVKDGGYINISSKGALYSRGYFGIEEGGIVDLAKGSKLVLNTGSRNGLNGNLYVGEGTELKIYSALYIYNNGLLMISGAARTYNKGALYYVNSVRTFNGGSFKGKSERMQGLNVMPKSINIDIGRVASMRFYDRVNRVTYTIRNHNIISRICAALIKIKIIPLRESTPIESGYENRFAIRLYDDKDNEIFYFERPEYENGQYVYTGGVTYVYSDAGMTYDEFYFYAMGVREYAKR